MNRRSNYAPRKQRRKGPKPCPRCGYPLRTEQAAEGTFLVCSAGCGYARKKGGKRP